MSARKKVKLISIKRWQKYVDALNGVLSRLNIKEARPSVVQQRKEAICQRCGGSGYFRIFSHPTACYYLCSCEAGKRAAVA